MSSLKHQSYSSGELFEKLSEVEAMVRTIYEIEARVRAIYIEQQYSLIIAAAFASYGLSFALMAASVAFDFPFVPIYWVVGIIIFLVAATYQRRISKWRESQYRALPEWVRPHRTDAKKHGV